MARKGRIEKKPYGSPKITKINLRSEEAVLTSCKTNAQYSGVGNYPQGCKYHGSNCNVVGS